MKNRKPLKIAVVVGVFPTVSEAFITNQLRFLISQGHDVDIFATRYLDNPLFSTRDYSDLKTKSRVLSKVALLPKGYLNRLFSSISVLLRFNKIVQLLKAFNIFKHGMSALDFSVFFKTYYKYYFSIHGYDVVHIHFGDNAVHLKNQISNFNKSVVVTFHGYDAHKFDNSFYSTLSQKRDITLTVNTNFTKSKVERLGFDASQIQILPVGLDTNFFKPSKNLTSDKFLKVLFLGRLIHFKAPILAIQIAEKFSNEGKRVFLIDLPEKDPSDMGFRSFTNHVQLAEELDISTLMLHKLGL